MNRIMKSAHNLNQVNQIQIRYHYPIWNLNHLLMDLVCLLTRKCFKMLNYQVVYQGDPFCHLIERVAYLEQSLHWQEHQPCKRLRPNYCSISQDFSNLTKNNLQISKGKNKWETRKKFKIVKNKWWIRSIQFPAKNIFLWMKSTCFGIWTVWGSNGNF